MTLAPRYCVPARSIGSVRKRRYSAKSYDSAPLDESRELSSPRAADVLEGWHLHMVTATTETGLPPCRMFASVEANTIRMLDPMRAINVRDRLPIVALGQWIDLINVESVIGFHARGGAFYIESHPS